MPPAPLAIETRQITKAYGARRAVDRLSLAVPQGSIFGLLGPRGAGKTTTLGLLEGRLRPSSGEGSILGYDMLGERGALQPQIAAVAASPSFYQLLSARDNLRLLARGDPGRRASIDRAMELAGLTPHAGRSVRALAPGLRRRLALSAALLGCPRLLLLDEPTGGLAPAEALELHDLVRHLGALGLTVLLASPSLREVEQLCTHAALLGQGRLLAQGPMADLLAGRPTLRVTAEPLPLVAAVAAAFGLAPTPVAKGVVRVEAPPELAARLRDALLSAGASVADVTPERRGLVEQYHELAAFAAADD